MDTDLTSDAVRSRSFGTSLRGYDRNEVDDFREQIARRIEVLEAGLADAAAKLDQLGIDDVTDLGAELAQVGADVAAILEEARRAATEMRERAAADADAWRSRASQAAVAEAQDAEATAQAVRSHAWREGSDLIDLAREEAERIVAAGRQDVLFMRAEAEREVLRLTGEARREAEELLRNARAAAEQITATADAEAQHVIAEARQSVESAIARTQTLEQRRTQLLQEIEATEVSLEAMQLGDAGAPDIGPPVAPPPREWPEDANEGIVRIVTAPDHGVSGPVDADELVAEVEQLRSIRTHEEEAILPEAPAAIDEEAATRVGPGESLDSAAEAETEAEVASRREGDESIAAKPEGPSEPEPEPADELRPAHEAMAQPEPVPEPVPVNDEDDQSLAGLFAQLREPAQEDAEPEPAGAGAPTTESGTSEEQEPRDEPALAAVAPPQAAISGERAFELRDRLLLPIENIALRAVKRHLVDLQNRVLEELRTSKRPWAPDPDEFLSELADDIVVMRRAAHGAGVYAASELTGRSSLDIEAPPSDPATREFAESLIAAVGVAHENALRNDAGSRGLASAISRVFRAWRTDEAERRLRGAAYRAYHQGLIDGLAASGVAAVTAVTTGRPCAECPVGAEWAPGAALPDGTDLPPAHVDCPTTIVPAGMAG